MLEPKKIVAKMAGMWIKKSIFTVKIPPTLGGPGPPGPPVPTPMVLSERREHCGVKSHPPECLTYQQKFLPTDSFERGFANKT